MNENTHEVHPKLTNSKELSYVGHDQETRKNNPNEKYE